VEKLPEVFRGVWRKITKEQAIANSFLARGSILYAEDSTAVNRVLMQLTPTGVITTIVNDKYEQHSMPEGFNILKVGDYEIKGSETDLTITGLTDPKIEFYTIDDQPELELLTNELLLNM